MYADFNALERLPTFDYDSRMAVTGYGTLASLAKIQCRLSEGLSVTAFEPKDIEVDGVVHFDPKEIDPAGREGSWYLLFNRHDVRESSREDTPENEHLCFGCRENLYGYLNRVGRHYIETCPHCGTSIMAPLQRPGNAT